jgi:tetratricopeptide (TPR) repeat protein
MELIINPDIKICLNMIVKNESKIITRMLKTVLPIIDTYCICDTGSTDNTIELINTFFQTHNISGKILNIPFVNFEYNRNIALQHAFDMSMSDYILLLDADMCLNIHKNFKKEMLLNYDGVYIFQGNKDFYYKNLRIIKNNKLFKYIGVTHEYIGFPNDKNIHTAIFDKSIMFIYDLGDGGCKTNKFERDIQLLLKGIDSEPENKRYFFYLANSYYDLGQYENAIQYYKQRIEMGGWIQEQWYSAYRIGLCYKHLNNIEKAIYYMLQAYDLFPKRVENLYEIIHHYRNISNNKLALTFYNIAKNIVVKLTEKDKSDFLFLQNDIYVYKLDYEYSIIAYYNGIRNINNEIIILLNNSSDSDNILSNMKFYRNILKPLLVKDFTNQINYNINDESIDFNSSSSCLLSATVPSNQYIMNIRYVNYNITSSGSYVNCDKQIITLNKYVKLTNDLDIIEEKFFELQNDNRRYLGIEDIKIFNNPSNNEIIFIGTILQQNECIGLCSGNYDIKNDLLVSNELTTEFKGKNCEKNWVYVFVDNALYILYQWFPLTICKANENNIINIVETNKKMPKIFKYARGSTCGFNYKNEIWFIVHLVSYEEPRNYYHLLVVLDKKFNLIKYSAPFNFEGEPIEYCLSLIVNDGDVIINYSAWDRTTKIGIYDKKYIDSLLVYK